MELRQLNTFRAVARTLSFTRTAELLNYAQSSVTAQVQALEDELSTPLFERLGRRIILTEAGRRLLEYAERLLQLEEEARAEVSGRGEPSGALVIGAVESLCTYRLPGVIRRFQERFSQVQLLLKPGLCADLRKGVGEGSLDLAFTMEAPDTLTTLVARDLVAEEILVLAHPHHPLAALPSVAPADFGGVLVLQTEIGCGYRSLFDRMMAEAGVSPGPVLEFGSVEAIKQMVMAGLGYTVLPRISVQQELAQGRIVALPFVRRDDLCVVTQVYWHREKWLSPALRAFLETVNEVLVGPARRELRLPPAASDGSV